MNLNKSLFILLSSVFIMQGSSCFSVTDPEIEGESVCRRSPDYWENVDAEAGPALGILYQEQDRELAPLRGVKAPLEETIVQIDARYEARLKALYAQLEAEKRVITLLDEDRETDVKKFKAPLNARLKPLRDQLAVAESQLQERTYSERASMNDMWERYRVIEFRINASSHNQDVQDRHYRELDDLHSRLRYKQEEINRVSEELRIPQLRAQIEADEQAIEAAAQWEKFHGRIGEVYVQAIRPHNLLLASIHENIEQCEAEHKAERAPLLERLEGYNYQYTQIFGRYFEEMKQVRIRARKVVVRRRQLLAAPVPIAAPAAVVPAA